MSAAVDLSGGGLAVSGYTSAPAKSSVAAGGAEVDRAGGRPTPAIEGGDTRRSAGTATRGDVLEGDVLVEPRFGGQPEHALCQNVA